MSSIRSKLRDFPIGETRKISYEKNSKGKEINIYKACSFLGIFCEVRKIKKQKAFLVRRLS